MTQISEPPDQQEFRDVISDLIRLGRSRSQESVSAEAAWLALALLTSELEVANTAEASLVLLDNDFAEAALPLARKCYEFGLVAQWLNNTKNEEAYRALSRDTMTKIGREIEKAGMVLPSELVDMSSRSGARPSGFETLKIVEQTCNSFAGGGLYAFYRQLSSFCHPGLAATSRWLREDESNPTGFAFGTPEHRADPVLVLWTVAAGLIWATSAADLNTRAQARWPALDAAGRRLGIAPVLAPRVAE